MPHSDPGARDPMRPGAAETDGGAESFVSPHAALHGWLREARLGPSSAMHWMVHAYRYSQLAHAMAAFGLAERLRDGPATTKALASGVGIAEDAMARLLRGLAWCGAVRPTGDGGWERTPLGACLDPDVAGSLHDDAIHAGSLLYPAWGALVRGIREGKVPFEVAFGHGFFEVLGDDAEAGARFDHVMTRVGRATAEAVAASDLLDGAQLVVDVGGGRGETLARVLRDRAGVRGIVFDEPRARASAEENLQAHGLQERCAFVGGDFFDAVPSGGDVYLLQRILHDWDDRDAGRILAKVEAALPPEGRVLVVEELIGEARSAVEDHAAAIDMAMLTVTGGRERSADEFRDLAEHAGLRLVGQRPTDLDVWILELAR